MTAILHHATDALKVFDEEVSYLVSSNDLETESRRITVQTHAGQIGELVFVVCRLPSASRANMVDCMYDAAIRT